jgi:sorting nexin-1/2
LSELGQSLADFGKAMKLLGACEGESLGKAFSELGSKGEILSLKLQKEVIKNIFNFLFCTEMKLILCLFVCRHITF